MLASLGSIIVCWVFGRVVDKLYFELDLVKIQFEVSD